MKCKDCASCKKGWFKSSPDEYVCIGVKNPFVINDINVDYIILNANFTSREDFISILNQYIQHHLHIKKQSLISLNSPLEPITLPFYS